MRAPITFLGFIIAAAMGVAAEAPSLQGKWTGTIEVRDPGSGTTISTPVVASFDQSTNGISGKIAREGDAEEAPVKNAKLDGGTLYFEASNGETSGAMKFTLLVNGGHLEGEMRGAIDTQDIVGHVKLEHAK